MATVAGTGKKKACLNRKQSTSSVFKTRSSRFKSTGYAALF